MLCVVVPQRVQTVKQIKLLRQVLWHLTERNQVSIQLVIQYVLFLCCGPVDVTEIQKVTLF